MLIHVANAPLRVDIDGERRVIPAGEVLDPALVAEMPERGVAAEIDLDHIRVYDTDEVIRVFGEYEARFGEIPEPGGEPEPASLSADEPGGEEPDGDEDAATESELEQPADETVEAPDADDAGEKPDDEGGTTDAGDASEDPFPRAEGGGWYVLSDGTKVQGRDAAEKAQAELAGDKPMTGQGHLAYRDAALKGLVAGGDVAAGNGVLHTLELLNLDSSVAWLQVFDAASHADVTLGTTTPALSFELAASAQRHIDDLEFGYNLGLVLAVTTTDGGSTAPTTGLDISATYGPQ